MLIILCCGVFPVPNGFIITDSQTGKKKQNEDDKGNTAHGGEKMGGREG